MKDSLKYLIFLALLIIVFCFWKTQKATNLYTGTFYYEPSISEKNVYDHFLVTGNLSIYKQQEVIEGKLSGDIKTFFQCRDSFGCDSLMLPTKVVEREEVTNNLEYGQNILKYHEIITGEITHISFNENMITGKLLLEIIDIDGNKIEQVTDIKGIIEQDSIKGIFGAGFLEKSRWVANTNIKN